MKPVNILVLGYLQLQRAGAVFCMAGKAEVLSQPRWAAWWSWFVFQIYLLLILWLGKLLNLSEPQIFPL